VTRVERQAEPTDRLLDLAGLCARLPLALRIAAEHVLRRPWASLEELTAELRGEAAWRTLTVEQGGPIEEMRAARSVFAWSYQALPQEEARFFRSLALHPGPDFCSAAAAALTGVEMPQRSLSILVGAHLLGQSAADRYQFHDLVRSYAMDQAHDEEPPAMLRNAARRLLTWYLRSADAAQAWINPAEAHVAFDAGQDDSEPETFTSYDQALQWFEQERGNLAAAVQAAEAQHMYEIAWKLAVVLRAFYMRFNTFGDWIATSEAGMRAAEALGDLAASAELLESLGIAYAQSHDLEHSTEFHRRALEIRRRAGDRSGAALSLNDLGLVLLRSHQLTQALSLFEESLEIYTNLGDEHWPPVIRANLAEILIGLGRYTDAEELTTAALATFRERGDAGAEGNALRLLSMARRGLGDTGHALQSAQQAVAMAVGLHNTMREGYWLLELGTVQHLTGRLNEALDSFHRSALLHHQIGDKGREARAWDGAGRVNRELGEITVAIELHDRAARTFRRLGLDWLLATALHNLAIAQQADRLIYQSQETAAEALRLLTAFSDPAAQSMREAFRQFS
jgi:tetratricopeptide (TPR) repeat protein